MVDTPSQNIKDGDQVNLYFSEPNAQGYQLFSFEEINDTVKYTF